MVVYPKLFVLLLLMAVSAEQDRLWHYRNLGKAFYENPTTQKEAVEQFRKALEMSPRSARERVNYGLALLKAGETKQAVSELEQAQREDPSIPHTWFNLGIVAKREGEYERGLAQMQQMAKLVPDEPTVHHNLGALYKLVGRNEQAVHEFELAAKLDPNLAAPHFQLYNAYRQGGRTADAARELALFQECKKRQEGAPLAENMETNNYTEIYETVEPSSPEDSAVTFTDRVLERNVQGIATLGPDLLSWSARGVSWYRRGLTRVEHSGLNELKDVVAIAAGDYDNDGLLDLCVITKDHAVLFHNQGNTFRPSPITLPAGQYQGAIWMDYDHDYDLDLILLGEKPLLLRNQGDAGFTDQTQSFPFAKGNATAATVTAIRPETPARDLAVAYSDREGVLYQDQLNGKFAAIPIPALPKGAQRLHSADLNHDSWLDLEVAFPSEAVFLENQHGSFRKSASPAGTSTRESMASGALCEGSPSARNGSGFHRHAQSGLECCRAQQRGYSAFAGKSDHSQGEMATGRHYGNQERENGGIRHGGSEGRCALSESDLPWCAASVSVEQLPGSRYRSNYLAKWADSKRTTAESKSDTHFPRGTAPFRFLPHDLYLEWNKV